MGHRTLKRVPLNFNAPLNEVWQGYINPYPEPPECNTCGGTGYNTETEQIANDFYSFSDPSRSWNDKITQDEVQALIDNNRLTLFTHTWTQEGGLKRREDNYIPTAEEVNAAQAKGGIETSHDVISRTILIEARAKRLGVFGLCPICNGTGELPNYDETTRKLYEEWKESEPPPGDGYQLWSTTTSGSPISPVFSSAEELANWCAKNATIMGSEKTSRENWLRMFKERNLETGSLLISGPGFTGAAINIPKK